MFMGRPPKSTAEKRAAELFGSNLSALMRDRDISMKELAAILNVHYDTVRKWREGDREPTLYNLRRLANEFRVSIDRLVLGPKDVQINVPLATGLANAPILPDNNH